jgi:hypothetical protein
MAVPRRHWFRRSSFMGKELNPYRTLPLVLALLFLLPQLSSASQELSEITPNYFDDDLNLFSGKQVSQQEMETVTLVQSGGTVDTVKTFQITIKGSISAENMTDIIEVVQSSSNKQVLEVGGNKNYVMIGRNVPTGGVFCNVSVTLAFDLMVGQTDYEIVLRRIDTSEVLFTKTVHYIICGISLYQMSSSGAKTVVSGTDSEYRISYMEALNDPISPEYRVHAFIQYPDGSTSATATGDPFPSSEGCNVIALQYRNQFIHDDATCNWKIPTKLKTSSWGATFSQGCGYGFYRDLSGDLLFIIRYNPYRVGRIMFDIRWDTLVQDVPVFGEDGYSVEFNIFIDGNPPLVVTDMNPIGKLFREEGGQVVYVTFFNGDLYDLARKEINVNTVSYPFQEESSTCTEAVSPLYLQTCTYITQPGSGLNLSWEFNYQTNGINGAGLQTAVDLTVPRFQFNYDPLHIRLDAITPNVGEKDGGTLITATGYFEGFDPSTDAIFFTGYRLRPFYIVEISQTRLIFNLPPKAEIGDGFDFDVYMSIGYAISNSLVFTYSATDLTVTITQSGTTQLPTTEVDLESTVAFPKLHDVFYVGACTPTQFTAIVWPSTNQIQSYTWSLFAVADTNYSNELLRSFRTPEVMPYQQTLDILPQHLDLGNRYYLLVNVTVPGSFVSTYIYLERIESISIGAFILEPPVRSIAYPAAPVRFYAVVTPPGDCFNQTSGLVMEWTAFGRTESFSVANATGILSNNSDIVTTPARLGREFIVPQTDLVYGTSEVIFKVWMRSNPAINGIARVNISIVPAALKAVIRHGESVISANVRTSTVMTAVNSFDPDEAILEIVDPWRYEWACFQLSNMSTLSLPDFTDEANVSPCASELLEDSTASDFEISESLIQGLAGQIRAIRYVLVVYRGDRQSDPAEIIVEIDQEIEVQGTSRQSFLTNYTVSLRSIFGEKLGSIVKYYEPLVIDVEANATEISWRYDLIEPQLPGFMTSSNMIQSPTYYSPDSAAVLNRKPLGIAASALSPMTNYTFQVTFGGSADYENTIVLISFTTDQKPYLVLPNPSKMNGTTETIFTATAGIAFTDSLFLYYFYIQDEAGMQYCVGGCTGYGVTYFRIGRVGNYRLSVNLVEARGRAIMRTQELSSNIVISEPSSDYSLFNDLGNLLSNGDDSSYTQGALDLAVAVCVNIQNSSTAARFLASFGQDNEVPSAEYYDVEALERMESSSGITNNSSAPSASPSSKLLSDTNANNTDGPVFSLSKEEMTTDMLISIAAGLRKIFCASFPTSGHSRLGVTVATMLSKCPHLPYQVVYDLMWTVQCCLEKTPKGTVTDISLQDLVQQLQRVAIGLAPGSRRRLLQAETAPNNLIADLQIWGGPAVTMSSISGKLAGYSDVTSVTDGAKETNFVVAVAENAGQLSNVYVNGIIRQGVASGGAINSSDPTASVFYTKGQCTDMLFNLSSSNVFLTLQTTPNFVTSGNFQDPPPTGNLANTLTWMRVFMYDPNGRVVEAVPRQSNSTSDDPCFCFRLPILYMKEDLNNDLERGPSMYTVTDLKSFEVNATMKGQFFNYDTNTSVVMGYDVNDGWVEACVSHLGIVAPTIGTPRAGGFGSGAQLTGLSAIGIVGILIAGLIFVVIAVVTSWVIATRAMAAAEIPAELAPDANQLYVERDIYGRGTIFEGYDGAGAREDASPMKESSADPAT